MSKEQLLQLANNIKDEDINFDDIPELTNEDIKKAKPFYEMPEILDILENNNKQETKKPITIRLKASTIETFKGLGKGYQTKISKILDNIAENIEKTS